MLLVLLIVGMRIPCDMSCLLFRGFGVHLPLALDQSMALDRDSVSSDRPEFLPAPVPQCPGPVACLHHPRSPMQSSWLLVLLWWRAPCHSAAPPAACRL